MLQIAVGALTGGTVTFSGLSDQLSLLSSLQFLQFGGGGVLFSAGTLPSAWSVLSALQVISMYDVGGLSGPLPGTWSALTNLNTLGVRSSVLTVRSQSAIVV